MSHAIRTQPCEACPYRRDVASGLWSAEEYHKLVLYDAPTWAQPPSPFGCHATPEFFCHGWAVVHTSRGDEFDLLALRFVQSMLKKRLVIPKPKVPLFASGAEAAAHGRRRLKRPSRKTRALGDRLIARYARLREGNPDR